MATERLQFDILARDLASASFRDMARTAGIAAGSLTNLSDKLSDVSGRVAKARVGLEGDKETEAELDKLGARLIALSKRKVDPEVDLAGYLRTRAEITKLELAIDRLDGKKATVSVDVDRRSIGGFFKSLAGAGEGGGGGLGLLGLLGPSAAIVGAGLAPGVAGLGLGLLSGGAAFGGGLFGAAQGKKQLAADLANIKQITTALKAAVGQRKATLHQALIDANKQFAKDTRFFQPFTDFAGALKSLTLTVIAPLRPIMEPLTKIVQGFGKNLATLGPIFTQLFKASLPFLRQFLQVMLQLGTTLLPVFTQALQQMVKSGALDAMTQGLVAIIQGVATFVKNLGPGMQASAKMFQQFGIFVGRVLGGLGTVVSWISRIIEFNLPKAVGHGVHTVIGWFDSFRHAIAASFDADRRIIATAWDTIWRNTVTRVRNGIGDVVGWFSKLPGRAIGALEGLGTMLWNFGHMALSKLWNGMKSVFSSVWGWFKSLPGKLLNAIGIKSPPDWAISAGRHIMGGILKGVISRKQELLGAWGGAIKFNPSLGVTQWGPLVRRALIMEGLNPLLAARVMYQMQTESGGNPRAINLTDSNAAAGDPSRGLMQVIGSTFRAYHWPGTSWNIYNPLANIAAALNYARHVYGPTLMNAAGQGIGSGRGYAFGTSSAARGWALVGERGPELVKFRGGEQVYPARAGTGRAGQRVVIEFRSGPGEVDQFLTRIMERIVRTQGGGDVQAAFGTSY